jgi:hypothetical protein
MKQSEKLDAILKYLYDRRDDRRELNKSKQSLENNVEEHKQKLEDYKADPDAHDNKGLLKNATPEVREKIINGRIKELNDQIHKNQGQLNKVIEQLNKLKDANKLEGNYTGS